MSEAKAHPIKTLIYFADKGFVWVLFKVKSSKVTVESAHSAPQVPA
nr:hypothetical protein [Vibrio navarrensis]